MENELNEKKEWESKCKTIVCGYVRDYRFTYFGKKTYEDRTIIQLSVYVAIGTDQKGNETKLAEALKNEKIKLSDTYKVTFTKNGNVKIKENRLVYQIFKYIFKLNLKAEIVGYALKFVPKEKIDTICISSMFALDDIFETIDVTKEEFENIVKGDIDLIR